MKKPKMFLFAALPGIAAQYRIEHSMTADEYPYIASYMTISGHYGVPHVRIGDWFDRDDVEQIERVLEHHDSEERTPQ